MKIGIFGGSFSPIHNGHLQIAEDCLIEMGLDKIIFLPNAKPPHKNVEKFSFENRVEMLKLAIEDNEKFEISLVEEDFSKTHYSYNTMKENFCNDKDKFYFIMGDDEFLNISSWYEYEKFLEITSVIVFLRKYNLDFILDKNKDLIEKYDINIVKNSVISISSTDIRNRMNEKKSIKYLIPKKVYKYIYEDLNYFDINKIKKDLKEKLSKNRYEHSLRVADCCKRLAKIYKIDENRAYLSGLVHDCAKNLEEFYMLNKKLNSDIIFDTEERDNENLRHAPIGAVVCKDLYGIFDEEILSAVRYHTIAKENMTLLEKILFISDKIEPDRKYDTVDELRRLADFDIDRAIVKFLNDSFEYLEKKSQKVHHLSVKARDYLINKE
ncbi:nicotinate (nicotinamide) nucleotide adenylyltransferase [uncultured Parvimonas sp.]|uniref:nicotinate (nicotinamide) nucleotide adenylyltransferase n=1 Tax=uncultured Parvimonas sp. TaxID=747372 RepID=UPI0028890AC3|nr:nicotinate (nicotinamide) nucleotide adenylyltransferase [uncultured Parvimonas sp.]